ncbi:putative zinc-binding metallopeptidase [Algoriphagus sp. D3-2-R+10]|uniref:zinc-binding metallopeptidase family protein n=1 Tax=Algoriphagus aurantiacus TaxID=3103948 RepID=UPI002B397F4F|nr:putative zinc-binding metallopeptidase [Algoriphagus sp. D3-2-R+10]MEB2776613.1 putative zinc-binding metallopeptidase [Algoriphagus sp. D3-2-R+10]
MKIFECGNCFHPLYFENESCEKCGHLAGYYDTSLKILTFERGASQMIADRDGNAFKYCQNKEFGVCNWLIPAYNENHFCNACELNRTIPDLSDNENFQKWQKLEIAKHRLIYQLQRLRLAIPAKENHPEIGLSFDFVSKQNDPEIMTGHADGVITILLSEADSVHREKMRKEMYEPYRTLIGHFRHEVGHYFWDRLVATNQSVLDEFHALFGNEQIDYGDALKQHYQNGSPVNWQNNFISQYATSHPWEDWAETWAHYLHIMDMTETAYYFGMSVEPILKDKSLRGSVDFDPYEIKDFNSIYKAWAPLSFAINSINRSMGIPDAYPFVVSSVVVDKMKFIHRLIFNL